MEKSPSNPILLNSSDMEQYPLFARIIDAFDNPDKYPNATVDGNLLRLRLYDRESQDQADETRDYFGQRYLSDYGPPVEGSPFYFYVVDGNGGDTYYYSWILGLP